MAIARYHIPNMKAIIRAGTSLLTYESPSGERHSSPRVWNRYARISQIMLTLAPSAMSLDPKASRPKPNPKRINPKLYFMAAEGLYLLSHHLEKKEANTMMKKEFRILNQETVISVVSAEYSRAS